MSYTLQIGDRAPNFENLLSTEGKRCGQIDFNNKPFKVIFFTCNHCPYVTGSDELTREVAEEFQDSAVFIGVNSNSENTYEEDSYQNMVKRMESFKFPWVYLHDETQQMAIDYGALKTPHFFIFNESWKLIYTGRNTDNPRDISQKTSNDLYIALDQATKDEDLSIPVTNPIGCNIKWEGKPAHWMPPEACDLI
jgi:thiol-disulfide isomerase/thioredoxin